MEEYRLSLEEHPDRQDIEFISQRLIEYNKARVGHDDGKRLVILVRDESNQIVGGLSGWTFWGWLAVDLLWVHEDLRRKGYGTRLIEAAEREAKVRGCQRVLLDTFSFQAPDFYQKLGYKIFGVLDSFAEQHQRIYLKKSLG